MQLPIVSFPFFHIPMDLYIYHELFTKNLPKVLLSPFRSHPPSRHTLRPRAQSCVFRFCGIGGGVTPPGPGPGGPFPIGPGPKPVMANRMEKIHPWKNGKDETDETDETSQTSRKILYQWEELLSSPSLSVKNRNARKLQTKTERHVSLRKSLWHWWSSQLMVSVCIRAHFTAVASILLVHKALFKNAAAGLRDLAIQEQLLITCKLNKIQLPSNTGI